jgi:hypothetical protein
MRKVGDSTGSTFSANAARRKDRDISAGSTFSANAALKNGDTTVAHYPQMPPPVRNRDNTGSTLSANTAVCTVK